MTRMQKNVTPLIVSAVHLKQLKKVLNKPSQTRLQMEANSHLATNWIKKELLVLPLLHCLVPHGVICNLFAWASHKTILFYLVILMMIRWACMIHFVFF